MRLPPTVVLLALAAGACTSNPTSVTGSEVDAPPIPPPVFWSFGALPDGTPFDIQIKSELSETVEGISGGVVIDLDGSPQAVGIVTFGSPPRDEIPNSPFPANATTMRPSCPQVPPMWVPPSAASTVNGPPSALTRSSSEPTT